MNSPYKIEIIDETSVQIKSEEIDCYIMLHRNFVSFALVDKSNNTIFRLGHFDFFEKSLSEDDLDLIFNDKLIQTSKNINLAVHTPKRTIIPSNFYSANQSDAYTKHLFDISLDEELRNCSIEDKFTSLFAVKKKGINYFQNKFKLKQVFDAESCMLKTYPLLSGSHTSCFVHLLPDSFTTSLYISNKLQYHQTKKYISTEDITFHLANILKQHNLSPLQTHLFLHGETTETAKLYENSKGRFKQIEPTLRPTTLNYPCTIDNYPASYFFNLYSFILCV